MNESIRNDLKVNNGRLGLYILILVFLLGFFGFMIFGLQQKYKKETTALKEQISALCNVRLLLQETLKNAVRKKREYGESFHREAERTMALTGQVLELLQAEKLAKNKIAAQGREIEGLKGENRALNDSVKKLSEDKEYLRGQVISFKNIQENLQRKIRRLLTRSKVELGQVVVTPCAINGKIIKANRKYNFVIIDLGKNDGIKVGMNLIAYRQENQIGAILVEKVYDELCTGRAVFNWVGNELDVGDVVRGQGQ